MTVAGSLAVIVAQMPGDPATDCPDDGMLNEPPSYSSTDGEHWTVHCDSGTSLANGGGVPAVFGFFLVLAVLVAIAGAAWRVSTARRLAREAGMNESDATTMSLLTDNGLEATYVASQVRQGSGRSAGPSAADRLRDLEELHKQGLITASEYAERREVIVKSL